MPSQLQLIKPRIVFSRTLQQFSCRKTTVGTFHTTSLQGFVYGDVVHQF
ncbi:MAG: hypothetical protein O4965_10470 [Trichodesmium sp. St19_bin1]|nr:hypothetical protein [Trichodesmium sp. St19_bin1]